MKLKVFKHINIENKKFTFFLPIIYNKNNKKNNIKSLFEYQMLRTISRFCLSLNPITDSLKKLF